MRAIVAGVEPGLHGLNVPATIGVNEPDAEHLIAQWEREAETIPQRRVSADIAGR